MDETVLNWFKKCPKVTYQQVLIHLGESVTMLRLLVASGMSDCVRKTFSLTVCLLKLVHRLGMIGQNTTQHDTHFIVDDLSWIHAW